MTNETVILAMTAASIGFIHTLLGPDHYLPFILLARAGKWSKLRASVVILLCGLGHVLSSVVLGLLGIAFGIAVFKLESIELARGDFAAWMMIIFGLTYFAWGISKVARKKFNGHHHHHSHSHVHLGKKHIDLNNEQNLTTGVLFAFFILGPCEPLIPLLMYPAARNSMMDVTIVTLVFGVVTIGTMLGIVLLSFWSLSKIHLGPAEKYSHALAGFAIFLCGVAVKFLGL